MKNSFQFTVCHNCGKQAVSRFYLAFRGRAICTQCGSSSQRDNSLVVALAIFLILGSGACANILERSFGIDFRLTLVGILALALPAMICLVRSKAP